MVTKQSIYICSTSSFCGKSIVSLGIALNLLDAGHKVGYFKPVGWEMGRDSEGKRIDEDAQLMISVLGSKLPMEIVAPDCVSISPAMTSANAWFCWNPDREKFFIEMPTKFCGDLFKL